MVDESHTNCQLKFADNSSAVRYGWSSNDICGMTLIGPLHLQMNLKSHN